MQYNKPYCVCVYVCIHIYLHSSSFISLVFLAFDPQPPLHLVKKPVLLLCFVKEK